MQAYEIMKNEIAGKEEQLVALHSAAARQGRNMSDGQDGQAADSFAAVTDKRESVFLG